MVGSKQAKRPAVKKTRLNSSKDKLSFVHKKETGHSFELSPFPFCVFFRRVFNLEMQNFGLENHHMMNAR